MDSAPSQQRDTAELLAPIEAHLSSLEAQMASIVTTIEDRLAAALQTVFNRIPSMIAAQSPQVALTTCRAKVKRISNSKEHWPLSEVTKVDEQSGNSNATSDHARKAAKKRASLSPRFPPCATEPSDEGYVAPSGQ
ncbi:hypothetical protein HPB50_026064 [Hyalomma asiaticum]|uniref:Uncharacterized protein n=1 Tax=Hyalomma asiaticum TaxID=266040 RepID=A0ACB7T525_HYAAI|nr:hypothetical protein HPB50_026064 [Hyalomma asiaticum]